VTHEFAFTGEDFERVRQLIAAYAGISLHERKHNMVYNRLVRRLRATGRTDFREYLDWVESPDSEERERFVNALCTNLTAFFREPHHFEMLAARARETAAAQRGAALRLWSSACSSGEEVYSAAITLADAGCAAEILGSDIDTDALEAARAGVYPVAALQSLGAEQKRRYFLRGVGANEGQARVRPELREAVKFAFRNLLAADWPAGERFDAVFCRNVMIYFDRATQAKLLGRFVEVLKPGALLFLGHSESCAAGHPAFRACGKTVYERR
jgi:chemotaxis protein methyltransferase CheR